MYSAGVVSTTTQGSTGTFTDTPSETISIEGQGARVGWAGLCGLGVINAADIPANQGDTPSPITRASEPGLNPYYPSEPLLRDLIDEASDNDENTQTKVELLAAVKLT